MSSAQNAPREKNFTLKQQANTQSPPYAIVANGPPRKPSNAAMNPAPRKRTGREDREAEQKRLQRALALFEYIDRMKEKEDALKRMMLADRISQQKEQLDRTQIKLQRQQQERALAEEAKRKQFLIERRKKLYSTSRLNPPIRQSLEHPHYQVIEKPDRLYQPHLVTMTQDTVRASQQSIQPGALVSSPSQPSAKLGSLVTSNLNLGGNQQHQRSISASIPLHIGSSRDVDAPYRAGRLPSLTASQIPRYCLEDKEKLADIPTKRLYRGQVYRHQAADVKLLRNVLNEQPLPIAKRYKFTRTGLRHLNLQNIRPRIDARRPRMGSRAAKRYRRFSRRKSSIGGAVHREREAAIQASFKTAEMYNAFMRRYEEPPVIVRASDAETKPPRTAPYVDRLAAKRMMYNTATRNRQRTLIFAQSGGTTGGASTMPATNTILSTIPTYSTVSRGLEAFAPLLLHVVTDADVEMPDIDNEEDDEADCADAADDSRPATLSSAARSSTPLQAAYVSQAPQRRPTLESTYKHRNSMTLQSRPPSALAFGSPAEQRRRSIISASRHTLRESPSHSRRSSISQQQIMALATERMSAGRRGPASVRREPVAGEADKTSDKTGEKQNGDIKTFARTDTNTPNPEAVSISRPLSSSQQKSARPASSRRVSIAAPPTSLSRRGTLTGKISNFSALVKAALDAREKDSLAEKTAKAEMEMLRETPNIDDDAEDVIEEEPTAIVEPCPIQPEANIPDTLTPDPGEAAERQNMVELENARPGSSEPIDRSRSISRPSTSSILKSRPPSSTLSTHRSCASYTSATSPYPCETPQTPSEPEIPARLPTKIRTKRTWEPISLTAAAETKKTVIPTMLLRLPSTLKAAHCDEKRLLMQVHLWAPLGNCAPSVEEGTPPQALPNVLRFWSPQ
ncbi:uncharacterized protein SPPG_06599 [Spizellomyces punctatus DAOM BR117]|uniref:Uncharacterized protein n=1 Tax=Spizellomyces punctatus (strain DAOM BR117) TaxID=645134 RepID=A0A0L0HAK8_SPIPD|nr:uncharacterized protein SPPG_06599 [Spizellomyces punctatus DAOM BR117]KNC98197.1 hypothetical protein SPPG_06599 [Spizellomyces punctatus DAOM BR117]|eukprot:XP_016606237.1 hypothetical protein SPPG_06599 [Spizellomyces punctatus DAOM BR117]